MAIGNASSADKGSLNSKLGDAAVSLRDATRLAEELWGYVISLGADQAAQEAALVALGFTQAEAASFWTDANYTWAVFQLYHGQIAQATAFDYHTGLAAARGPS